MTRGHGQRPTSGSRLRRLFSSMLTRTMSSWAVKGIGDGAHTPVVSLHLDGAHEG